jgi:hypothetical protein
MSNKVPDYLAETGLDPIFDAQDIQHCKFESKNKHFLINEIIIRIAL